GEYVWFVDSDDCIEEGCLYAIKERLEETAVDALLLQYRNVYSDGTSNEEKYSTIDGIVEGKEVLLSNKFFVEVPFAIYRREFLLQQQLSFYPGIYHEDNEFKPRMLYLARTCASYDRVAYNYFRGVANSISSTLRLKNGLDDFVVMNSLYAFVDEQNIQGRYRRAFYTQIGNAMKMVLRTLQTVNSSEADILVKEIKENRHLLKCMCCATKLKIQLGGVLMYANLPLGLRIFKLYV
ncbi:MAG: glycosyltransferase, partial [Muribaculaceae bacterium]|nr:glycosyltransferase [Muribaculaceae bacterium]